MKRKRRREKNSGQPRPFDNKRDSRSTACPSKHRRSRVNRQPVRSCIGCRKPKPKSELIRVVKIPEDKIRVDITGKQSGRGAYICKEDRCLQEALKDSKLAKALKVKPGDIDKEELGKQIYSLLE